MSWRDWFMTDEYKRVLMVSYYYPPIQAVGTIRSVAFSKYLAEFGWKVAVLTVLDCKDPWTPHRGGDVPPGVRVVRARELNLSRIVDFCNASLSRVASLFRLKMRRNWFRELFCIPDPQISWMFGPALIREARKVDVIYVSCSPFSASIPTVAAGALLKKRVIVDFRDAWSLNPHVRHVRIHSLISSCLERFVLRLASKVIVNTPGAEKLYRKRYPEFGKKFLNIPNGFDEINAAQKIVMQPFTIMHVGNFYGERTPRRLLEALQEIGNSNIQFVQVGGAVPDFEEFKETVNIRRIESVSSPEALQLMKSASLLYLKQAEERGVTEHIAVAAKTYEYISTGIPILVDAPSGDNLELVKSFGHPDSFVFGDTREENGRLISNYLNSSHEVVVKPEFTKLFSREYLTRELESVLKGEL